MIEDIFCKQKLDNKFPGVGQKFSQATQACMQIAGFPLFFNMFSLLYISKDRNFP
jgi:hypothetical protein